MPPLTDTRGEEEGAARLTPYQALALGLVTVAVVLLAAAYYWYNYTGWAPFSFQGATPYAPGGPKPQGVLCAQGDACRGGACRTPCTSDAGCPGGTTCASGYCTLPACTSNKKNCPDDTACESGLCKKSCCGDGRLARGGSCLPACSDEQSCTAASAACYAGACMAGAEAEPAWEAPRGVGTLRFKKAVFAVTDPRGVTHRQDVTAVLNGMAVAYRKAPTKTAPTTLRLDRPLNAFSFTIPGVNDAQAVAASDLAKWKASATSLTGSYRVI
jgi:hypothetical protein